MGREGKTVVCICESMTLLSIFWVSLVSFLPLLILCLVSKCGFSVYERFYECLKS